MKEQTLIDRLIDSKNGRDVYVLAALFIDAFSIDWLVDLTGFKAS